MTTVSELTGYAVTAAELRRIADALATLPPGDALPYVSLSILPPLKTVEAVDALGLAILGVRGETKRNSNGWRHKAERTAFDTNVYIGIHAIVPGPPDERDIELDKLRARVAELEARDDGQGFSRPADDPTPVSGARVEPHTGAVTDEGLVDESAVTFTPDCGDDWHDTTMGDEPKACPSCGESD